MDSNTQLQKLLSSPSKRDSITNNMPALIFVGKHGSGKSILAAKIATTLESQLLNPTTLLLDNIQRDPELNDLIKNQLANGQDITSNQMLSLVENATNSPNCKFKGYVLDGIPACNLIKTQEIISGDEEQAQTSMPNSLEHVNIQQSSTGLFGTSSKFTSGNIESWKKEDIVAQPDTTALAENVDPEIEKTPIIPQKQIPATTKSDIELLAELTNTSTTTTNCSSYCPVLVYLEISDSSLKKRRSSQRVDPETGIIYNGDQIKYSYQVLAIAAEKKAAQENGENEDENAEEVEEEETEEEEVGELEDDEEEKEKPEIIIDVNEDDNMNEIPATDVPVSKKKHNKKIELSIENKVKLTNNNYWKPIDKEILARLLVRPEDMEEELDAEINFWNQNIQPEISSIINIKSKTQVITSNTPQLLRTITIDATQHPDIMYKDLLSRIENLGITSKVITPKVLSPMPVETKGKSIEEIIKYYINADLDVDEPIRNLSQWGKHCPVSLRDSQILIIPSQLTNVVAYKGLIYFMETPEKMTSFIENPEIYISVPPCVPQMKVCIIGQAFSGCTSQGKILAHTYGLKYISVDECLIGWDNSGNQDELMDKIPIYKKIVNRLKSGKDLKPSMMFEVLQYLFAKNVGAGDGWVIEGFPTARSQINKMVEHGIVPQNVIVLKTVPEVLTERSSNKKVNSRTGLAIDETLDERQSKKQKITNNELEETYDHAWIPNRIIPEFPFVEHIINESNAAFEKVIQSFEKRSIALSYIAADTSIPSVSYNIQKIVDPFVKKAEMLTNAQILDLPHPLELGKTKDYCPVSFVDSNILTRAVEGNLVAKYDSQYYYLSNEEAKISFLSNPAFYSMPTNGTLYPPLRLLIIGPEGAGKTSCVKMISEWSKTPYYQFKDILKEYVDKLTGTEKEDAEVLMKEFGLGKPQLEEITKKLFNDPQYKDSGFIIQDLPTTRTEAEALISQGLNVDAIISLKIESPLLAHRKQVLANKRAAEAASLNSEDSVKYAKAVHTSEDDETELNDIQEQIEREVSKISEGIALFEAGNKIPIIEIDANKCLRYIYSELNTKLKKFIENRGGIFSNAYEIEPKIADVWLAKGVKQLSKFRKYCPVTLYNNKLITKASRGYHPIVFEKCIYFLRSKAAKKEFLQNTFKYIQQPNPQPRVKPTICVVGAPKSGKTMISQRLASVYDLVYLTVPIIIETLMDGKEDLDICDQIRYSLENGEALSDELTTEAIRIITSRGLCKAKGWVMDGYPYSYEQSLALEEAGIMPQLFIEIDITQEEEVRRCDLDPTSDPSTNPHSLSNKSMVKLRDSFYHQDILKVKERYDSIYNNWISIDGSLSKWNIAEILNAKVADSILKLQNYTDLKFKGKSAPMNKVGISLVHVQENMSTFGEYCIVSLKDDNELSICPSGMNLMAEYQNIFYRMANGENLRKFLENPEKYVGQISLPEFLPLRRPASDIKALFPKSLELLGYCPVTFAEGPAGFDSIILGSLDCLVQYKEKLYVMANDEQTDKFMRTPWKFIDLKLPKKLPPKKVDIPISNLPIIGYLEQTLATKLNEALKSIGQFKPKYPYVNMDDSASMYMAYYLKANNPKSKDWIRKKYNGKLDLFKTRCELIPYLSKKMGQLVYVPPEKRGRIFEDRMQAFFSLGSK